MGPVASKTVLQSCFSPLRHGFTAVEIEVHLNREPSRKRARIVRSYATQDRHAHHRMGPLKTEASDIDPFWRVTTGPVELLASFRFRFGHETAKPLGRKEPARRMLADKVRLGAHRVVGRTHAHLRFQGKSVPLPATGARACFR